MKQEIIAKRGPRASYKDAHRETPMRPSAMAPTKRDPSYLPDTAVQCPCNVTHQILCAGLGDIGHIQAASGAMAREGRSYQILPTTLR